MRLLPRQKTVYYPAQTRLWIAAALAAALLIHASGVANAQEDPGPDTPLSSLTFNGGLLRPDFDPDVMEYELFLLGHDGPIGIVADEGLLVTAVPADPGATFEVNGIPGVSGVPTVIEGALYDPEVHVLSPDGTRERSYTVRLRVIESSVPFPGAMLTDLTIDPLTLDFDSATYFYEVSDPGAEMESIDIRATADSADAVLRINGAVVSSGSPVEQFLRRGLNKFDVIVTTPDGGYSTNYRLRIRRGDTRAFIGVANGGRGVGVGSMPPLSPTTITVRSSPGGPVIVSSTVASDESGQAEFDFEALGLNIRLLPGMEITMDSGPVTKSLVVQDVTLDVPDFDADTISGTAPPGSKLYIHVGKFHGEDQVPGLPEDFVWGTGLAWDKDYDLGGARPVGNPYFTVGPDGAWTVRTSDDGVDLTPDVGIAAELYDEDGDFTEAFWFPRKAEMEAEDLGSPMAAILNLDTLAVEDVAAGIAVGLTVRETPSGTVLFSDSRAADAAGNALWGGTGLGGGFDFGIDLQPGMEVTVTWGEMTRSHTLADVRIDVIDLEADIVTGVGAQEGLLYLVVGEWGEAGPPGFKLLSLVSEVSVGSDGSWMVDLAGQRFDIQAEMIVAAMQATQTGVTQWVEFAELVPVVDELNPASVEVVGGLSVSVSTASEDGASVAVNVAPDALSGIASVNVAVIGNLDELVAQAPPPEGVDITAGFVVNARDADGTIESGLGGTVELTFTIDSADVPGDADVQDLTVAFWNGADWVIVETTEITPNSDGTVTLVTATDHFTLFSVFYDPGELIGTGPINPIDMFSPFNVAGFMTAPPSVAEESSWKVVIIAVIASVVLFAGLGSSIVVFWRRGGLRALGTRPRQRAPE